MKKIIAVAVVVVVVFVGAWFWAVGWVKPPQERLQTAFINLTKAKNGHIQVSVDYKPSASPAIPLQKFVLNSDGEFQVNQNGGVDVTATVSAEGTGTGASLSGKGEARLVNGNVFYRIDEMPPFLPGVEQLLGKWLPGSMGADLVSEKLRVNVATVLQKQKVFSDVTSLGGDKVGKFRTTHLRTKISPSGYAAFIDEITAMSGGTLPVNKDIIQKNVASLGEMPFDIWVDSGNNLRKISVTYENPKTKAISEVVLHFSAFTGSPKIEEPQVAAVDLPTVPATTSETK